MPSEFAPYTERELDIMAEIDPNEKTPEPPETYPCTYCGHNFETVVTVNDSALGPSSACFGCMALLESEASEVARMIRDKAVEDAVIILRCAALDSLGHENIIVSSMAWKINMNAADHLKYPYTAAEERNRIPRVVYS